MLRGGLGEFLHIADAEIEALGADRRDDMGSLEAARPDMIATLDTFRDTLEYLGDGLGVTDPVSGPVVLELK